LTASSSRLPQRELHSRLAAGEIELLDLRQPGEWAAGHAPGATFLTGAQLPARIEEVAGFPKPVAVVCGSGYRSSVAASVLARDGRRQVTNTSAA
jgi:hydroxyacylglutathione hydrolase